MKRHTFLISFCIHQVTKTAFPPEALNCCFLRGEKSYFFSECHLSDYWTPSYPLCLLSPVHNILFNWSFPLAEGLLCEEQQCPSGRGEVSASPQSAAAVGTEVHDAKIRILLEAALCPKVIQTGFYWASQNSLLSFWYLILIPSSIMGIP